MHFPDNFQLPSTAHVFRGAELHHSTGAIPAEGQEALAAALLVPGPICCDCVVTSVLWPLSARGDRATGPSCASSTSLVQTLAAFQGSVRAHCSPARVITLAISAQAKGSKAAHRSGFQVGKVYHSLTVVTTSWECTGGAQPLKEPWINGGIYPEHRLLA